MDSSVINLAEVKSGDTTSPAADREAESVEPTTGAVLVAVDLTEDSREAVLWASDYAHRMSAPLHILHCLHDPVESPGKYNGGKTCPLDRMTDAAQRMLTGFVAELREACPDKEYLNAASTRLVAGLPAQAILDEARALGAELIILGSRGRNGVQKLLFGSVARRVTQLSPVPVTLVKARQP